MKELIGLYYPVKNTDDQLVGKRKIAKVIDSQNTAALMILFKEDANSGIYLGYAHAADLLLRQYEFKDLPEMT
jgi:hypothetical protein